MAFGSVTGTFSAVNASIPASFAATLSTGSGVVNIGDLVVCLVVEQTALTVTSVTDSQGGTYTAQNTGTLTSTVSGRLFWRRVTAAGTLTSITATCTSSTHDGVIIAIVINGPFLASPVDASPANAADVVSPFTAPATGTMAQTTEVVVSWAAATGSNVPTAVSPTVLQKISSSSTVVEGYLGTQVPPSTATVTPSYTGTAPTNQVLGTISFTGAIAELDASYSTPLPGPVWPWKGLAAHLQQTLAWSTFTPAPISTDIVASDDGSAGPSFQYRLIYRSKTEPVFVPTASTAVVTGDYGCFGPVFEHRLIYRAKTEPVFVPPVVTYTPPQWPDRIAAKPNPLNYTASVLVPPTQPTVWSQPAPWPDLLPTRKRPVIDFGTVVPPAQVTVSYASWPDFVPGKKLPTADQQALAWAPFTVAPPADSWLPPFAELPNPKVLLRVSLQQFLTLNALPLTASVDGWVSPFFEVPKRLPALGTSLQQFLAFNPLPLTPPAVYGSWSEPARRWGLPAAEQQVLAWAPLVAAAFTYFQLTSWPDIIPIRQRPVTNFCPWTFVPPPAQVSLPYAPWADFAWRKNPRPYLDDPCEWVAGLSDIPWFAPLASPVRVNFLLTSEQQVLAWSTFTPAPISTDIVASDDGSAGPSFQYRLIYRAKTEPVFVPSTTPTTSLDWLVQFGALPTALRTRPYLDDPCDWEAGFSDIPWFAPLVGPIRVRRLPTSEQQALAWSTFTPTPVVRSLDWLVQFETLPKALRTRPYLDDPCDWVAGFWDITWFASLSEPPKSATFAARLQQILAWSTFTTPPVIPDRWPDFARRKRQLFNYEPLAFLQVQQGQASPFNSFVNWPDFAQPPKKKPPLNYEPLAFLQVALPSFASFVNWPDFAPKKRSPLNYEPLTLVQIARTPWVTMTTWPDFAHLKRKPGLGVPYQQFTARFAGTVFATTITVTMSAFEVNSDSASAVVRVSQSQPAVSALVSIEETGILIDPIPGGP